MSWQHAAVGGLCAPPAEVDRVLVLVLVLGASLKVLVLVVVAAPEVAVVLHSRFLDGQTLLYLDLGHAQLLLRHSSISAVSCISSSRSATS